MRPFEPTDRMMGVLGGVSALTLEQEGFLEHHLIQFEPGYWSWTYKPCLDCPTQFGYHPAPFHKRSSDDVPTMSGLNGFHHLGGSRGFPPWGADPGLAMPPLWGSRR